MSWGWKSNLKKKQVKDPEHYNRELLDLWLGTNADTVHNPEQEFVSGLCSSSHGSTVTTPAAEFGSDWMGPSAQAQELKTEQEVKKIKAGKIERE